MNSDQLQLKKELRQAGAKTSEVGDLAYIATRLKQLKASSESNQGQWARTLKPIALMSMGLALGAVIVMLSQSVEPTSWLYPVQQVSDAIAIKIHPAYRETIMMHQAQQVNDLVASHASTHVILSTLNDYTSDAAAYRVMPHASYAAFDYCKSNLEQAATAANTTVRGAIKQSLDYLDTT